MRVGLNATCFNARPSGAKQRFEGIYGALVRASPETEFLIYQPADCAVAGWFAGARNVRAVPTPLPSTASARRALRGTTYWQRRLRDDSLDLFEMFHLPMVRAPGCPTITTIHDARPMRDEEPLLRRMLGRSVLARALRQSAAVITVSNTMKQELLALEPRANIVTIYNGLDSRLFDAAPPVSSPELPTDYLLAVGHFEARKNYAKLIEAMIMLRRVRPELALVIVGNDGGGLPALRRQVGALGLTDAVRLLTNTNDDRLRTIYRGARAVVFPSRYEGFGIPVLEAMAARRPLVTSNLPVFVELTEGKGAYFDPDEAVDMARAITTVLDDAERQRALIAYGDRRLGDFSFERLAAQVRDVYRQVLTGAEPGV